MLYLSNKQKIDLLKNQTLLINSNFLYKNLIHIQKDTINYIDNLLNLNTIKINNDNCVTPPLWQFGHIILFYLNNTLNLLHIKKNINFNILTTYIKNFEKTYKIDFNYYFDSFYTERNERFNISLCYTRLKVIYTSIIKIIASYINNNKLDPIDNYLIMLSILHNDMHNENYIFSYYFLMNQKILVNHFTSYIICEDKKIENIFINVSSGSFYQGSSINSNNIIFDNETPPFLVNINCFSVSKYPITEYEYLDFINNNGYLNNNYWSYNGLLWKTHNSIKHPLYWFNTNNMWFRKHYTQIIKIGSNLPICNISYYEAEAYCKWKNVRLITESEYEYLATNHGKSLYPWGNTNPNNTLCNLNNINDYCVNVDNYVNGNNIDNISQLIGNVCEWCDEFIYPYNNFSIDPVYREMSYPYFGQKKICRGGCFCASEFLINSKYRNAQLPDCRVQFIGFRVCLKSI